MTRVVTRFVLSRTSYLRLPQIVAVPCADAAESKTSVKVCSYVVPRITFQVAVSGTAVITEVLHGSVTLKVKVIDGWKLWTP